MTADLKRVKERVGGMFKELHDRVEREIESMDAEVKESYENLDILSRVRQEVKNVNSEMRAWLGQLGNFPPKDDDQEQNPTQ